MAQETLSFDVSRRGGTAATTTLTFAFCDALGQNAAMPPRDPPPPMTLGNMRHNGVGAVIAQCKDCRHQADVVVDHLPADVYVPEVGRRLRCSKCGGKRIETRPAWHSMQRQGMGHQTKA